MKPRIEIFSQGEEIISGQIVDTNSAWLASEVNDLGFRVIRHSAVGDDLALLKQLLLEIADRADCCLCSGGLGPTVDDLTAQAVSEAFSLPLLLDEVALEQIRRYFQQRQRLMVDSNRKQALLPQGAVRLDNHWGTAPGFAVRFKQCWFYFMPGVPSEMKKMFAHGVQPHLRQQFELEPDKLVIVRTIGLGESDIQQKLQHWRQPDKVRLGFRTTAEDIEVKLSFPASVSEAMQQQTIASIIDCLGDIVYRVETTTNRRSLTEIITAKLEQQGQQLRLTETVSYGAIAARFAGSPVLAAAQVRPDLLEKSCRDLLLSARQLAEQDSLNENEWRLIQLYCPKTQRLLTYLTGAEGERYSEKQLAGNARQIQQRATIAALDLLRKY